MLSRSALWLILTISMMSGNSGPTNAKPLNESLSNKIEPSSDNLKDGTVCSKESCIHSASILLKNMDPEVNPCDNFYRFTCGGYLKSADIPDDSMIISIIEEMNITMKEQMLLSLEKPSSSNESQPLKKTKEFYRSCMNEFAIEKFSVKSLFEILEKAGGWPVMKKENWNASGFHWIDSVHIFNKMGYQIDNMPKIFFRHFLRVSPSLDQFAATKSNETKNIVYNDMINIAVELGADYEFAKLEFEDMKLLVSKLHDFNIRFSIKDGELFIIPTLEESNSTYDWRLHADSSSFPLLGNFDLVDSPEIIQELEKIMAETPKRVQANFIAWSVISQSAKYLRDDIREKFEGLFRDANMKVSRKKFNRRNECVISTMKAMSLGLLALYVNDHLDKFAKKNALKIVEEIRSQMNKSLELTNFSKVLEQISFFIAYPNEFLNHSTFEKLYNDLEISPHDYLQNNFNALSLRIKLSSMSSQNNWESAHDSPDYLTPEGFTNGMNSIHIMAGALQIFSNGIDNPKYMKLSSIGSIIGHEMYHIVHLQDRVFNDSDNLIISPTDQCFIDRYGNFSIGGTKLNGTVHLKENIADNGGTKMAYLAYSDWLTKENKSEQHLPGFNFYNNRQMFWINYGNMFCSKSKDPNFLDPLDSHPPNEFRVIGTLSNNEDFAKDFDCPVGSNMNPHQKCHIW